MAKKKDVEVEVAVEEFAGTVITDEVVAPVGEEVVATADAVEEQVTAVVEDVTKETVVDLEKVEVECMHESYSVARNRLGKVKVCNSCGAIIKG